MMANLRDEGTNPMVGLGFLPRKWPKGKKHNPNKEILEDPNQLARNGWQSVPNPWTHCVANQYVDWCHIDKFWLLQKHDTHVKNNATHFSSYKDHHMKSWLVDVNLAIWGTQKFKHNVVPLYVAQMVYVEVAMGVEMDWSKIPTSS